jgi:hypothetical protein
MRFDSNIHIFLFLKKLMRKIFGDQRNKESEELRKIRYEEVAKCGFMSRLY